jgi:hypothetical protein
LEPRVSALEEEDLELEQLAIQKKEAEEKEVMSFPSFF